MTSPTRECCDDDYSRWNPPSRHVTIRRATPEERANIGPFFLTGKPMKAKRWLLVDADKDTWVGAFGIPHTATSKAEIVSWATRFASKNDAHFIRPPEFVGVVGKLPSEP